MRALEGDDKPVSIAEEIKKLEQKAHDALEDTYSKLTPWQKTQVARHPERPHYLDFVDAMIEDFTPLAGDRYFAEDEAIVDYAVELNCDLIVLPNQQRSLLSRWLMGNVGARVQRRSPIPVLFVREES